MNEDSSRKKVAIEDLLLLKRAERPPAEFWTRFEQELRAKQLAAIVEKRPWWRTFSDSWNARTRRYVPLGATAILAITLLSLHEYRSPSEVVQQPNRSSEVPQVSPTVGSSIELAAIPLTVTPNATEVAAVPESESNESAVAASKTSVGFASSSEAVDENSALSLAGTTELMPSLSEGHSVETSLAASLASNSGFESRVLPARSPMTEPLSQLQTPKSVRLRDRYLGGAFSAGYSVDSSATSPERSVTRLRDRQLRPEEFSRFDARGNSLSIKL